MELILFEGCFDLLDEGQLPNMSEDAKASNQEYDNVKLTYFFHESLFTNQVVFFFYCYRQPEIF